MAREILFKAKRIDNGKWVEGSYLYCKDATTVSFQNEHYILKFDGYGIEYHAIDKETICQYTGLTDNNGNKIWENDVCSVNLICDDSEETEKCIVRYGRKAENFKRELGFYVEWTKTDYLRMDICYWTENKEVEVIDNIFDNPRLLEGGA